MKVIRFLAAAAMALTATTAMAQGGAPGGAPGGQGGGQRGGNQTARLMEGITLDAAQQTKLDSILAASRAELMKMREEMQASGGAPGPELMEKMRAVTTKRNAAIRGVLTAEQAALFDKNLAAMPAPGQRPPR